ncbi:MAG TPA: SusD/RagB family nutrient-binding outer membrane lipoprotein [Chitinophaga sp.]|uniref:SusD/RagB family nutrient-binding outer membrane lipoprotein n=1 Tax=Chitinophaga sp. TaxID=1869181 RepID=UPI002D141171|nr:SusD/RagB family nutrient-binding outer membrane lipoprotein [Chitinophaga sp.]HVI43960.1 SusD/RagB family nutrient-binding outer membrane lipoprotein [Chitinophaga sp.]
MKKSIIIKWVVPAVFAVMAAGCTKGFEQLNVDPSKPTESSMDATINGITAKLQDNQAEFTFLYNELYYPLSELNAQSRKLGVDPISRTNDALWTSYYSMMKNVRDLEDRFSKYTGDKESLDNLKAAVKTTVAYVTYRMVDRFGDIPFSQSGYSFIPDKQILQPVYDKQTDIYRSLLDDLKWSSEHFVTDNRKTPSGNSYLNINGTADAYFSGVTTTWQAFANSLRLRYAVRIADKDAQKAAEVIADVVGKNLPLLDGATNDRKDAITDYLKLDKTGIDLTQNYNAAGSSGNRLGTTMWQYLSTNDNVDGSGIIDPRTYVWYMKNKDDKWLAFPQQAPETALTDVDAVYDKSNRSKVISTYSPVNLNMLNEGNYVPRPVFTISEVNFLLAEIYLRGIGVAKDAAKAETYYYKGIRSSITYWYDCVDKSGSWSSRPTRPSDAAVATFLANPKIAFAGDDVAKLKLLYAQEWLSFIWQPDQGFFLMRRTTQTPHLGAADNSFYRLRYPPSEITYNQANYNEAVGRMGGDETNKKIFWMK